MGERDRFELYLYRTTFDEPGRASMRPLCDHAFCTRFGVAKVIELRRTVSVN
ncbi:MAG: hypothetical protein K8R64_03195 [Methanosarcinaceae archaeon]|nr:hypothetical protein [Methanosarcinaceae archaeon]